MGSISAIITNLLTRLEMECKCRDSRICQLRGLPARWEDGPLYLEVGVKLREDTETKLPLAVSPHRVRENDVPGIVSSILMTVDRYSFGLM